jgi:hypothetical protein
MLEMRKAEVAMTLAESVSRATPRRLRRWARNGLVVGKVGISLALLIAGTIKEDALNDDWFQEVSSMLDKVFADHNPGFVISERGWKREGPAFAA